LDHPTEAKVFTLLGDIQSKNGNDTSALAAYHKALSFIERKSDPLRYASIERSLGELYLESDQPSAALPHFEHALEAERAQPQRGRGALLAPIAGDPRAERCTSLDGETA
jgi:tetratricopeptide (TPR) repeat protein